MVSVTVFFYFTIVFEGVCPTKIFVLGLCLLMGLLLCCSTLCSRKPRLLATEEVTLLWGQWALRSVKRNQRLTSRKDFALAGQIRKLNKKRWEESLRQRCVHSTSEDE